ncbi:MAG: hypothetical protein GQ531_01185 [Sulfurovum sp.]|nr:hypothetical protein [Sulfurovum sp.]
MDKLSQNLYITYSNQRARDLKANGSLNPLDKVITLEQLILETFEQSNFQIIIDDTIGASIIYKLIQDHGIKYFSYLESDADSLNIIYSFIVKCHRNNVAFDVLLSDDKLVIIREIDELYQSYKKSHSLADSADIENIVLSSWDDGLLRKYNEVFVDEFSVDEISFVKSKMQSEILEKLGKYKKIVKETTSPHTTTMIRPSNVVFDSIDEVKTALKIARKLLEEGDSSDEVLIVASDTVEYAPLYKLFLDEYSLQGFSSVGTALSSFHNTSEPKVKRALDQYKSQVKSIEILYGRLGLVLSESAKESMKSSVKILDDKTGIELTEPNQLVGLKKTYKHIVFIGTDINHFPPSAKDNFLYSYEDDVNYFYANNYFTSSQTQLKELKRLSENLYIITATYSGKRELSPSILLDGKYDETIDLSDVKSMSELALDRQTITPESNTKAYYESITSDTLTEFDGKDVEGLKATHLSASQINKYLSCPLAYLYSNKIRLQAPDQSDEGFDVMEQGSLMHLCYELFGKKIKETQNSSREQEELYDLMYDISIEAYEHKDTVEPRGKEKLVENIHHQIFLSTLQAGLKDERDAGLLVKFVDYYSSRAQEFEYFQNTEFEKEFALDNDLNPYEIKDKYDKNYFIKGFIDRFDNLASQVNVIDYKSKKISSKSGKHKETQEKIDELKDVQLALYILYAKQQYPGKEYYSSMLSFKGDSKAAHFGELYHESFSDEYESKLKGIIFDTKEGIENGVFGFDNSDEKACGWCDFRFICNEGVLGKEVNDAKYN